MSDPIVTETVTNPAGETPTNPLPADGQQEPFDQARAMALIEKLRSENKNLSKLAKTAEKLEAEKAEREKAEMTEVERVKAELEKYKQQATALQRKQLQREIAEKVGLPLALAERLQGDTAEDLEADAKAVLEVLPKAEKPGQPKIGPTNPGAGATQGETYEQKRARVYGWAGGDLFSPGEAAKRGGGVIFTDKE